MRGCLIKNLEARMSKRTIRALGSLNESSANAEGCSREHLTFESPLYQQNGGRELEGVYGIIGIRRSEATGGFSESKAA